MLLDIAGFREAQRHRWPIPLGEGRQAAPCEQGPWENRPQAAEGASSQKGIRSAARHANQFASAFWQSATLGQFFTVV
jgi:hypothetical protein